MKNLIKGGASLIFPFSHSEKMATLVEKKLKIKILPNRDLSKLRFENIQVGVKN